jgi:hypothetical protein
MRIGSAQRLKQIDGARRPQMIQDTRVAFTVAPERPEKSSAMRNVAKVRTFAKRRSPRALEPLKIRRRSIPAAPITAHFVPAGKLDSVLKPTQPQ